MIIYSDPIDFPKHLLKRVDYNRTNENSMFCSTHLDPSNKIKVARDPTTDLDGWDYFAKILSDAFSKGYSNKKCVSSTKFKSIEDEPCHFSPSIKKDGPYVVEDAFWVEVNGEKKHVCKINLDNFEEHHLEEYIKKFGKTNIENYNNIMSHICSLTKTEECPTDVYTATQKKSCMLLNSNSKTFAVEECKKWASEKNHTIIDLLKEKYCEKNPSSEDCGCINRKKDKKFQELSKHMNGVSECWYKPCGDSSGNLHLTKDIKCVSNSCFLYFDIDRNNIEFLETNAHINCNFGDKNVKDEGIYYNNKETGQRVFIPNNNTSSKTNKYDKNIKTISYYDDPEEINLTKKEQEKSQEENKKEIANENDNKKNLKVDNSTTFSGKVVNFYQKCKKNPILFILVVIIIFFIFYILIKFSIKTFH